MMHANSNTGTNLHHNGNKYAIEIVEKLYNVILFHS